MHTVEYTKIQLKTEYVFFCLLYRNASTRLMVLHILRNMQRTYQDNLVKSLLLQQKKTLSS